MISKKALLLILILLPVQLFSSDASFKSFRELPESYSFGVEGGDVLVLSENEEGVAYGGVDLHYQAVNPGDVELYVNSFPIKSASDDDIDYIYAINNTTGSLIFGTTDDDEMLVHRYTPGSLSESGEMTMRVKTLDSTASDANLPGYMVLKVRSL